MTSETSPSVATASVIILLISLVWAIIILILKCIGPTKVGFLSGRFVEPAPFYDLIEGAREIDMDAGVSLHKNERDATTPLVLSNTIEAGMSMKGIGKKFSKKVTVVRAIFLISGFVVIVVGALYYGIAVKSFNSSFDKVRVSNNVSTL